MTTPSDAPVTESVGGVRIEVPPGWSTTRRPSEPTEALLVLERAATATRDPVRVTVLALVHDGTAAPGGAATIARSLCESLPRADLLECGEVRLRGREVVHLVVDYAEPGRGGMVAESWTVWTPWRHVVLVCACGVLDFADLRSETAAMAATWAVDDPRPRP